MILKLTNVDMTNKLIYHDILHEYASKVVKYYCEIYDSIIMKLRNEEKNSTSIS